MKPEPGIDGIIGESSSRLSGLAQAVLLYFAARSRLLSIEAEEAATRLTRVIIAGLLAMGLLGGAWLLLMPVIVSWLAGKLGWHWTQVAAVVGGAHLVLGILFSLRLKSLSSSLNLFQETINQFQKDREWVAGNKNGSN